MPLGLKIVTAPTVEPVTLVTAKARLRVTVSAEDDDITALIAECRAQAEAECGRAFVTQTWDLTLDDFPGRGGDIRVPLPPLQSVTWVKYRDAAGSLVTMDAADYWAAATGSPGRVVPVADYWPGVQYGRPEAVQVRFVAGYAGTASGLPPEVRAAVLAILSDRHANPDGGDRGIPPAARRLLDSLEYGEVR